MVRPYKLAKFGLSDNEPFQGSHPCLSNAKSHKSLTYGSLAERQGFEPWVPVRVQRFSRPSRSTAPASFLVVPGLMGGVVGASLSISGLRSDGINDPALRGIYHRARVTR